MKIHNPPQWWRSDLQGGSEGGIRLPDAALLACADYVELEKMLDVHLGYLGRAFVDHWEELTSKKKR